LVNQLCVYTRLYKLANTFIQYEVVRGVTPAEEDERWDFARFWFNEVGMPKRIADLAIAHMRSHDQALAIPQHRALADTAGYDFSVLKTEPGFMVARATRRNDFYDYTMLSTTEGGLES
jgi:hypothetical protein